MFQLSGFYCTSLKKGSLRIGALLQTIRKGGHRVLCSGYIMALINYIPNKKTALIVRMPQDRQFKQVLPDDKTLRDLGLKPGDRAAASELLQRTP